MRRTLVHATLACSLLAVCTAAAQTPAVTRLIVAFPPGGPVDFVGRVLADQLGKELNGTVVVENRPGANGNIAAEYVAKAAPDGAVLFLTSVGAVAISPALYERVPYDVARDFAPVSRVVNNTTVFVTATGNPAAGAAEFAAETKKGAGPTPIGSSGVGSLPHLTLELFQASSQANVYHVPYKGAAPVIADVMAGRVAGFFGDLPGLIGNIRGGKLKPLGVAAPGRNGLLPEVKTLAEQGIAGAESNNWYAVLVPAKTPPATIERLNGAIRRALEAEAVRSKLVASGAEPAPSSPDELAALIRDDGAKWAKIIRDKNIKPE
jgi:tripartite-type tricarboxylate transporter receptor subunit TctC